MKRISTFLVIFAVISKSAASKKWHNYHQYQHRDWHMSERGHYPPHDEERGWHKDGNSQFPTHHGEHGSLEQYEHDSANFPSHHGDSDGHKHGSGHFPTHHGPHDWHKHDSGNTYPHYDENGWHKHDSGNTHLHHGEHGWHKHDSGNTHPHHGEHDLHKQDSGNTYPHHGENNWNKHDTGHIQPHYDEHDWHKHDRGNKQPHTDKNDWPNQGSNNYPSHHEGHDWNPHNSNNWDDSTSHSWDSGRQTSVDEGGNEDTGETNGNFAMSTSPITIPSANADWGGNSDADDSNSDTDSTEDDEADYNPDLPWSISQRSTPSLPSSFPNPTTAFPEQTTASPDPTTVFQIPTTFANPTDNSDSTAQFPNPSSFSPSSDTLRSSSTSVSPPPSSQDVETCERNCLVTSEYQPVCGTNYRTYNNMGYFLCAQACGVDVRIFLRRACPSLDVPTTGRTIVPNDLTGVAAASYSAVQCILSCTFTDEDSPVCGSDDITYDNPSMLLCAQRCGYNVRIKSMSACSDTKNPTPSYDLPKTTALPYAAKLCLESCSTTSEYSPVCGTNDVTYKNPSEMSCANLCGLNVEIKWQGSCSQTNNDNMSNRPPIPSIDDQRQSPLTTGVRLCLFSCPVTDDYQPVCGTNGITYVNPSQLQCDQMCGIDVDILQRSPCSSSTNNNGNNNNQEVSTSVPPTPSTMSPQQVQSCILSCPQTPEHNPVCGTDGITYKNPGHLHCAKACGVSVTLKRTSACSSPAPAITIPPALNDPLLDPITNQQTPTTTPTENTIDINGLVNGADVIPQTQSPNVNISNPPSNNVSTIPTELLLSIFTDPAPKTTTEPDEEFDLDPRYGEDQKE